MPVNITFGIHAAMNGLTFPFIAKVELTVMNNIYAMLKAIPIPKLSPMPPLTFRAEMEAPIIVSMNAENALEILE